MENRWKTIVKNLQRSKQKNVDEDTYQDTIECQFQLLGWFDGIETRPSIPNGASSVLKPDIVLNKDEHRVLPIEIKRPTNLINDRQVGQLSSYMRRLRLSIGLYIGENIQLYYDTPDDDDDAVSVCKIEIEENNTLGIKLCQLLSYENFDINVVENFCKEQLRMINARNDFRQRFQEYVSPENFKQNILELLKEKFIGEGYDDAIINSELKKIDFKICNSSNVANNREPAPRVNSSSTSNNRIISTENRGTSSVIFEITSIGGISAKAVYLGGKRMKVLKGSTIASSTVPSFQLYDLRKEVIKKATKLPNGTYCLLEDYIFDSPSAASKIVYGNSSNGWICWKTKDGSMLKEIVGRE